MVLFFILVLIALVILMSIRLGKDNFNVTEFFLHCFAIIMAFWNFMVYLSYPQAIDVYRGETTLQITYKDSIHIDSVVVFK